MRFQTEKAGRKYFRFGTFTKTNEALEVQNWSMNGAETEMPKLIERESDTSRGGGRVKT